MVRVCGSLLCGDCTCSQIVSEINPSMMISLALLQVFARERSSLAFSFARRRDWSSSARLKRSPPLLVAPQPSDEKFPTSSSPGT